MPHIHELFDFTVSAYIVHSELDRVLLVNHKKYNIWMQPGGHVELNEDPDQALFREIKEETGLDITVLSSNEGPAEEDLKTLYAPNFLQTHTAGPNNHRHIDLKYLALAKSADIKLADREHNDIKWFSREELANPDLVHPAIAWYCFKALEKAAEANI